MNIEDKLKDFLRKEKENVIQLLKRLVSFPSFSGEEEEALNFLFSEFKKLNFEVKKVPILDDIIKDSDYVKLREESDYKDKFNLLIHREGESSSKGRSVILQSHIDVVGAKDWPDAFHPRVKEGVIYGRGACDAKGQIVTLYLVLKALDSLGIHLKGDVNVQIVIEEEPGGNGALSFILDGYRADGVIVLEGTELRIHPANRGALWFKITIKGKSVHMGRKNEGINAIEKMVKVIRALNNYEKILLKESKGYHLFQRYQMPVQLNLGMIRGGELPSTVAGEAILEGGVGFLPNKNLEKVKKELKEVIEKIEDDWIRTHYQLDFNRLRNEAYEINENHPLVTTLYHSSREANLDPEVFGWNVSCDARLYAVRGGMPVVVFGPGDIAYAHSNEERIDVEEILKAAEALVLFLVNWAEVK